MSMFVPLLSVAAGVSKLHRVPCSTVLLVLLHEMTGAVVSTTVTCWLQDALSPQALVASQVRVASKVVPQWPAVLVTVLTTVIVIFSPFELVTVGGSKVQAVPCSTVLLVPVQETICEMESSTVTF